MKEKKHCPACNEDKPLTHFPYRSTTGYRHICKSCTSERQRAYYQAHRTERLAYQLVYNRERRIEEPTY